MIYLQSKFPGLTSINFTVESPHNHRYNCIAWAAEDINHFWWPTDGGYWPAGVQRDVTLDAFIAAFATKGYELCDNELYEDGFIKIAIFAKDDGKPTHAARQKPNGRWTSKCGKYKDIEHDLTAICGSLYGNVVSYMKKPI